MSSYHQIFIRSDRPREILIEDIDLAARVSLADVSPRGDRTFWGAASRHTIVELEFSHRFDDDGQLDFESYPIALTIRDSGSDKARERQAADQIFENLRRTGRYDLLYVYDLQELVRRS
ncbi:hypothetical protein ACFYU5_23555 [Nocardia aobensis]|uniref:Uncharacterized protein n=1 Tax=Nocardia aobensis TaxID=257277 RepID=A0ABW6P8D5_9NOCA